MRSMPGDAPILVNSAGCGAAMKDYGHLLGTAEAVAFAARVRRRPRVARRARSTACRRRRAALGPVIVQDPCHLRHVQRAHDAGAHRARPRRRRRRARRRRPVLRRRRRLLGAAAGAGRRRSATARWPPSTGPRRDPARRVVASANPGCAMHLAAAGLDVRHPVDLVAEAIARDEPLRGPRRAAGGDRRRARRAVLRPAAAGGRRRRDAAPGGRPLADPGPAGRREGGRPAPSARRRPSGVGSTARIVGDGARVGDRRRSR